MIAGWPLILASFVERYQYRPPAHPALIPCFTITNRSVLESAIAAHMPSVYQSTGGSADCHAMFTGDQAAIRRAQQYLVDGGSPEGSASSPTSSSRASRASGGQPEPTMASTEILMNETRRGCDRFRNSRGYFTGEPLSRDEAEFPIAYSILMYDNVPQVRDVRHSWRGNVYDMGSCR